jgi:transposase-like protein
MARNTAKKNSEKNSEKCKHCKNNRTVKSGSRFCYNTIQFIDARRITRKGNYYNLTIHFPRYVLISSKPIQSSF